MPIARKIFLLLIFAWQNFEALFMGVDSGRLRHVCYQALLLLLFTLPLSCVVKIFWIFQASLYVCLSIWKILILINNQRPSVYLHSPVNLAPCLYLCLSCGEPDWNHQCDLSGLLKKLLARPDLSFIRSSDLRISIFTFDTIPSPRSHFAKARQQAWNHIAGYWW